MPIYKLGRQKKKTDLRTLQFATYILATLPPPPAFYHLTLPEVLEMLMNDSIGDCTIAGWLHEVMVQLKNNGIDWLPTDQDALAAYEAVGGYVPGDESTDNGCACLDVLKYAKNTGIGGKLGGAFVEVNVTNLTHVQLACYLFGGLYIGINMPVSVQSQPAIWDIPAEGLNGDGAVGSWGGHCVCITGYDADGLDLISWGQKLRMTWAFWQAYVEESYASVNPEWVVNPAAAPNGYNMTALTNDLNAVAA